MATNGHFLPNMEIPSQEDNCSFPGQNPCRMDSMEHSRAHFPGYYCYPCPPPPQFGSYGPVYMGMAPMYIMQVPYFAPHHYLQAPDMATSRVPRRSRSSASCSSGSGPVHQYGKHFAHEKSVAGQFRKQDHGNPSAACSGQEMQAPDFTDLMFLFAKQLSPSGVNNLGRIVLPKREAETYLPYLYAAEGVALTMADYDTHRNWTFRYRFWLNSKNRMYLLQNTRDFVKVHNLQERDMIALYRDTRGHYVIRAKKNVANSGTRDNPIEIVSVDEVPTEEEIISRKEQTLEFLI